MEINRLVVGSTFEQVHSFDQSDVIKFAEASGDYNPIHLDDEYAAQSLFKRRIIHGFLGASIFSNVFGTLFPGEGTIYLKQDMSFFRPQFVNVQYTAKFEVVEVFVEKNRALVKTEVHDEDGQLIISGEALIKHPCFH